MVFKLSTGSRDLKIALNISNSVKICEIVDAYVKKHFAFVLNENVFF